MAANVQIAIKQNNIHHKKIVTILPRTLVIHFSSRNIS